MAISVGESAPPERAIGSDSAAAPIFAETFDVLPPKLPGILYLVGLGDFTLLLDALVNLDPGELLGVLGAGRLEEGGGPWGGGHGYRCGCV